MNAKIIESDEEFEANINSNKNQACTQCFDYEPQSASIKVADSAKEERKKEKGDFTNGFSKVSRCWSKGFFVNRSQRNIK